MHWTAFLAYRRFPAHARVADDLPCAGCGYNLRSALANGNCPECGKAVGDSLFVLNQPEIVGRSLRTIGKTYLGILALLFGCLNPSMYWPFVVALGIMGLLAIVRTMAVAEMRFRGAIGSLPVIGNRLKWLWWFVVTDAAVIWLLCVLTYLMSKNLFNSSAMRSVVSSIAVVGFLVHILSAFAAGWLGTALATMLWYTWARWEFVAQRIALALAVLAIAMFGMIYLASTTPRIPMIVIGLGGFLLLVLAMTVTATGLTHLGNGAEGETDTWEDIIDTSSEGQYSRPTDGRRPEPPPIKVE